VRRVLHPHCTSAGKYGFVALYVVCHDLMTRCRYTIAGRCRAAPCCQSAGSDRASSSPRAFHGPCVLAGPPNALNAASPSCRRRRWCAAGPGFVRSRVCFARTSTAARSTRRPRGRAVRPSASAAAGLEHLSPEAAWQGTLCHPHAYRHLHSHCRDRPKRPRANPRTQVCQPMDWPLPTVSVAMMVSIGGLAA
jgi:hypothetical protein